LLLTQREERLREREIAIMAVIADEEGGGTGVLFRFFFYKSTVDDFELI
jgi:hypothetical protein